MIDNPHYVAPSTDSFAYEPPDNSVVADVVEEIQEDNVADHLKNMSGDAHVYRTGEKDDLTIDDLRQMTTPQPTDTHYPVPHVEFVENILEPAEKILSVDNFKLDDLIMSVSGEDDSRLFGAAVFRNGREDINLAIGFRQSNDKSMSAALAVGGNVRVCKNMMFCGQETVMRKHTKNIKKDLRGRVIEALYDVNRDWKELQEDTDGMKTATHTDDEAYALFGLAYGRKILSIQQMSLAKQEWDKPSFDHGEKSLWRWYNACTQVFKGLKPNQAFRKYRELHEFSIEQQSMDSIFV